MNYREIMNSLRAGQMIAPTETEMARREAGVSVERLITDLTIAFSHREKCPGCGRIVGSRTSRLVGGGGIRRRYYRCECGRTWSRDFREIGE